MTAALAPPSPVPAPPVILSQDLGLVQLILTAGTTTTPSISVNISIFVSPQVNIGSEALQVPKCGVSLGLGSGLPAAKHCRVSQEVCPGQDCQLGDGLRRGG